MSWFLRALFAVVLASMLGVTGWASLRCPLFAVPREVYAHPWFVATMFDAYWGFTTFFIWICFKQTSLAARTAWFIAVMLLGNIGMSAYCLSELAAPPASGRLADLLVLRRDGPGWLGWILATAGVAVVALA